jgi:hypothetical protein
MECGTRLEHVCPECGTKLPPEAKFCMECGANIAEAGPRRETPETKTVVPKLEDMKDRLYIPEPIRNRMEAAEQDMAGENRLVTALFADISAHTANREITSMIPKSIKPNCCDTALMLGLLRHLMPGRCGSLAIQIRQSK